MTRLLPQWLRWDRRRTRLRKAWPGWLDSLAATRRELADLNQATERDFLQVGEKLERFLGVSGRISEQCSMLVGFLSGEQANRGAGDLSSILERARAMAGQAESNRLALEQMLGGVGRIMPPLADLNAKMRSFRVMATLIRIEGSRLNQAGADFQTLAEDVHKLASDIEENGKTILSGSLELRAIVRRAGSGLTEFEARQAVELPRIQTQAGTSLAALRERRGKASDVSREMASQYGAVRREFGELVMSLQVHDITRQQVEHAAAALGQWDEERSAPSVTLLVRVCGLQRAQLEHSKESFLAGVARVRESLAGISRNVSRMAAESTDVLGCEAGKEDSFLAEMEQGFAGIRTTLAEYAKSRHTLSTVAETVADGVRNMSEFVETIEEIGLRMQRIALNANIKAIRIGEQGCALGTVADAIQRLAADSTDQTLVVARGIREVAEGSGRLSAELMESGEDLTRDLEQVIAAFHAADEENRRRLGKIGETGRSFSQELDALCAGIQADALLADVMERSCGRLDEIVAAAEPLAADDRGAEHTDAIRSLEAQYTMHAERAVHQQTTGAGQPVTAGAAGGWEPSGAGQGVVAGAADEWRLTGAKQPVTASAPGEWGPRGATQPVTTDAKGEWGPRGARQPVTAGAASEWEPSGIGQAVTAGAASEWEPSGIGQAVTAGAAEESEPSGARQAVTAGAAGEWVPSNAGQPVAAGAAEEWGPSNAGQPVAAAAAEEWGDNVELF